MPGGVPDRWANYSNIGSVIPNTRFFACKVPLEMKVPKEMDPFNPGMLFNMIKVSLNKNIGLLIDLTNTTRYYRAKSIVDKEAIYKKIFTEGHKVPNKQVVFSFFKTVDNYLKKNKNSDSLIGVHCTHGVNRTGYLICRYLIDKMDFKPQRAIDAFNDARGHKIERKEYLEDLLKRPLQEKIEDLESEEKFNWFDNYSQNKMSQSNGRKRKSDDNNYEGCSNYPSNFPSISRKNFFKYNRPNKEYHTFNKIYKNKHNKQKTNLNCIYNKNKNNNNNNNHNFFPNDNNDKFPDKYGYKKNINNNIFNSSKNNYNKKNYTNNFDNQKDNSNYNNCGRLRYPHYDDSRYYESCNEFPNNNYN